MVICIIPLSGLLSMALTDETRVGAKSCGFIENLFAQYYPSEHQDHDYYDREGRANMNADWRRGSPDESGWPC